VVLRAAVSSGAITETIQARGVLDPLRRVNVGSQVSGVVKEIYVDYNSVVSEGQVLAEIDTSILESQVAIQQANVERQRTDIANQELQLENQRRQLERARESFDRGLQNEQQYESLELAVRVREAQVESTRRSLVQAEAGLTAARLNVSYATIRAPIDGVIIQRRVDRGQAVQASMTSPSFFWMCTPLELLKLTARVDEANVGRVRPGMRVQFRVGTYGQEMFEGTVEAVRLNAMRTNDVVTYPVWIHVPNDDLRLRPSMTAEVFIHVSETAEAVARIPNEALRFRPSRAAYQALNVPIPEEPVVRAIDRQGDRIVDPDARRAVAFDANATTIDQLFAPLPRADSRGTVYMWRESERRLISIPVRVGVSDGSVTELIEGDLRVGDELVTGVVLPEQPSPRGAPNPLLGNPRGRGR
jgi:HlyD family secretion protein